MKRRCADGSHRSPIATHASLEVLRHKRLLYVDADSELIRALKRAYARVMDEEAQVFTKGGASYARVLDHGVAFGCDF